MPKQRKNPLVPCNCGYHWCLGLVSRWSRWRHLKQKAEEAALSSHTVELEPPPPPKRPCIARADSDLRQLPEDVCTEASGPFVDEVPPDLYAGTHQAIVESDGEDSEDAPEEAVEASDVVNPETIGFEDGEDVDMEGDLGPHGGAVSDWDIFAQDFNVEAEELGEFKRSLLRTP